mgnify:FL=1
MLTFSTEVMNETDLPAIEWDGEYKRYRRVYREIYRGSLAGRSVPWVAEISNIGIIGQVFLTEKQPHEDYADRPYMFLSSFRVKPAYRNLGLGTLLLKVCEVTAGDRKIDIIVLNCARSNQRSRSFYEKNGFVVVRNDPGKWSYIDDEGKIREETNPAWVMRKKLVSSSKS